MYASSSELIYRSIFSGPLFAFLSDTSSVYRLLYETCSPFGATVSDIKVEGGKGDPGSAAVVVACRDAGVLVRLQLTNLQIHWTYSPGDKIEPARLIVETILSALRNQSESVFPLNAHILTWAGHIQLKAGTATDFFADYLTPVSKKVGGSQLNSYGFSKAPEEEKLACAVNLQPSVTVEGGIYTRFDLQWTGELGVAEVIERTREEVWTTLRTLGLIEN